MVDMDKLLQVFGGSVFALLIGIILLHPKWGLFHGSSDSSDYVRERRENYGKCTAEFKTYQEFVQTEILQKGDLIQCQRTIGNILSMQDKLNVPIFDHWGVYVGNDTGIAEDVVHLVPNGGRGTEIRRDTLKNVVKDSKCRINNLNLSGSKRNLLSRADEVIAQAALNHLDNFNNGKWTDAKYNLIDFNCEHFATLCAFGEPFSDQADNAKEKNYINVIGQGLAQSVHSSSERGADIEPSDEL